MTRLLDCRRLLRPNPKMATPTPTESVIPRQSLQAEVVSRLRDEIVEGVWAPGSRLQERLLCERYGISRSPLREAYQVLTAEGLLELSPNRGAVVTAPTLEDVIEHHILLRALECLAIELACERATDEELHHIDVLHEKMHGCHKANNMAAYFKLNNEVHRAIVAASHNEPLLSTREVMARHIIRTQNLRGALERSSNSSMHEHDVFIEALLARKKRAAVTGLRKHLNTVEREMRERLEASES